MTPLQLKKHRLKLGFSQSQYAGEIGASIDGYQKWEQGKRPVPKWLIKRIEDLKPKAPLP